MKFRFGRYVGISGPGFVFVLAPIESAHRVELGKTILFFSGERYVSEDNKQLAASGLISWRIADPEMSAVQAGNSPTVVRGLLERALTHELEGMHAAQAAAEPQAVEQEVVISIREPIAERGLELLSYEITRIEIL